MKLRSKNNGFLSGPLLYVVGGLGVALLASGLWINHQSNKIDKLNKKITTLELAADIYVDTIVQDQLEFDRLVELNAECANKRATAAMRADLAERNLAEALNRAFIRSQERVNAIRNENRITVCSAPVPARTVELLVEAAHSANRSKDSN